MSELKPLTLKGLNVSQTNNFKLDTDIVSTKFTNVELCNKHGVDQNKISGRKASLVTRGHLAKRSTKVKSTITKAPTKSYNQSDILPFKTNLKLRNEVITLLSSGLLIKNVVNKLNVSQSSVTRTRKYLVSIGQIKKGKGDNLINTPKEVVETLGNVVASFSKEIEKPKNANPYNDNGLNKELARNKMSNYIVNSDTVGTILSLPFSSCKIEKKILLERPNYDFLGVEFDEPTFNDLKDTVKAEKLPIKTYFGKLGDKIYGTHENTYSNIIADYCGQLPTFSNEIEYAIRNKVVETNGIIAMTFSKPIRGTSNHSKFILSLGGTISNNPNDNRCNSDKATEAYFNRIIGNDFQFVEIFNYTDPNEETGMGCPMTLVILKRLR